MVKDLLDKLKESSLSVIPVSIIVLLLHFTISGMPTWTFISFIIGTILLIIGISVFTMGSDMAMMPIGEAIGSELTKSRKLWLIIISGFILGIVVTIAEPDLQVLTRQVPAVPDMVLVLAVAIGVGAFLVIALLRILFQIRLAYVYIISYITVFAVASFAAPDFLAVAFDAGGVTTGPITVPFILSLGAGISAVRGGKNSEEDSFGLCSLCSIGPLLAVLIMGMFFDSSSSGYAVESPDISDLKSMLSTYGEGFVQFFKEVITVLLPIVIIFIFFQIIRLKLSKTRLIRILMGILYTLFGIVIFMTGVNIGFMPAGVYIGKHLAQLSYKWILIPLSAVIGFFVVYAEPAVHVLNKQVEDITSGAISKKMMMAGLSIGVSLALVLSIVRVLTGISIWYFLLPGYAVALVITFFTPKIFTAIAFDSGGVAAGTMAAAFLLPFTVGICEATGGNIMTDAFGVVSMIAMMPLITIQIIGFIYNRKLVKNSKIEAAEQTQSISIDNFLYEQLNNLTDSKQYEDYYCQDCTENDYDNSQNTEFDYNSENIIDENSDDMVK